MSRYSRSRSPEKCSKSLSKMPSSDQRLKRLKTEFHLPYCFGSSRHCEPERVIQSTASRKRRQSRPAPRRISEKDFSTGRIFCHCSSVNLTCISKNSLTDLCQHNLMF